MFLKRWRQRQRYVNSSYAQCGEDLIIRFLFDLLRIEKPTYLDIGAHDPFYLSNTGLLYEQGCRGINIEPDPVLFERFVRFRPQDINLNIGIGISRGQAEFYRMRPPSLNTFSKAEAERLQKEGVILEQVGVVRTETVADVISQYCQNQFPHFLNLDVEGLDEAILHSLDYSASLPAVICLETLSYSTIGKGKKDMAIIRFLEERGYLVYADTYINTIFVQQERWQRRGQS